ncbi:MAG TPA: class I SAM-dependent methyltransferase [Polyangia bacterium]|nr:class I SAM-dependent methyltransferase [Polyangia bacterium]
MSLDLKELYATRAPSETHEFRRRVWRVLWQDVFSQWVQPNDTVVDLGAGYCEFINAAQAQRRIAVDLNPDTRTHADPGVDVQLSSAEDLAFLGDGDVDVVFSSNFLEHLPSKDALARSMREVLRVLKPGGTLILMGPNIRFVGGEYWDFFDHHLALTDRSLSELLESMSFEIVRCLPRFLPYTFKNRGPRWPWLVSAYLKILPLSARLMGKQFLIVARTPTAKNGNGA